MKTIAIMQPYLFPYIGYFQLINTVDEFVIYDDVQYIVRGWINRNNILINGEKKLFTISLDHASANKMINEIEIKDDFVTFRKTVALAYTKAPYKEPVLELLDRILLYKGKNLDRFIGHSLSLIAEYLDLNTTFLYSSELDKDNNLRGQHKIMSICKLREATNYINPIGGQEIYDREYFANNGIDLKFIRTGAIEYPQFGNQFAAGLSIIDIMMFNNKNEIQQMLKRYELV